MKKTLIIIGLIVVVISTKGQAINNYGLAKDPTFQKRVQMLMLLSATQIIGEDTLTYSPEIVEKRHDLAMSVMSDITGYKIKFSNLLAAQGTLTESSTDNDIQFTINSIWNDVAGVRWDDD